MSKRKSGRQRTKGVDKGLRKLDQRTFAYNRLDTITQATMRRPGSRKKPD